MSYVNKHSADSKTRRQSVIALGHNTVPDALTANIDRLFNTMMALHTIKLLFVVMQYYANNSSPMITYKCVYFKRI